MSVITFLTLVFSPKVVRLLGQTGINIATRIMGLILAATAAQFVLDGCREATDRTQNGKAKPPRDFPRPNA